MTWQKEDNKLYKEFHFRNFREAFSFMEQVAKLAESQKHHPYWVNDWNKVMIWLSTHDAGDTVTEKDTKLASSIDDVYEELKAPPIEKTDHSVVQLYADGGSRGNPGPSASGFALLDTEDNILLQKGVYLGRSTNNQAEYQALKLGLEAARDIGAREVLVFMDSLLVVNQMKGTFKVKNVDLLPINESIKKLLENFKKVTFTHVPRALNALADSEVNKALDAVSNV